MSNPQRLVLGLVLVIVIVLGVGLAASLLGGGPAATPSPVAEVTPSPTPEPTPAPTEAPSPSERPAGSPSSTPTPVPTTEPTAAPGEPATVVLTALVLDAKADPDGMDRRVHFTTQGSGPVSAAVRVLSPQSSAELCLEAGGSPKDCTTTADGTLTATAPDAATDYVVSLRGDDSQTPMVELTLTFPAATPSIAVENARFDGTLRPDLNGLQAILTPRTDGDVTLDASWGGHPFDYRVDLVEQGGPGSHVISGAEANVGVQASLPVTAGNPWKLVLQNVDDGFGITLLDATIGWP